MPIIETKGGVMSLPADSTAGKRGLPARTAPEGGNKRFAQPDTRAATDEPIGTDVQGGNVRPIRRTPTPGSGTGE